jgi:hypothetical protein
MSLSGIALNKLNENVDFNAVVDRYTHKLLKGNFAILPTRQGTYIFALLGKANGIKKIMTTNPLFGLHYIDYDDSVLAFDPLLHTENTQEWLKTQCKINGFREVKQFISWRS